MFTFWDNFNIFQLMEGCGKNWGKMWSFAKPYCFFKEEISESTMWEFLGSRIPLGLCTSRLQKDELWARLMSFDNASNQFCRIQRCWTWVTSDEFIDWSNCSFLSLRQLLPDNLYVVENLHFEIYCQHNDLLKSDSIAKISCIWQSCQNQQI